MSENSKPGPNNQRANIVPLFPNNQTMPPGKGPTIPAYAESVVKAKQRPVDASKPRKLKPSDCRKYLPPNETRQRSIVAKIAACFMILFLGLALIGLTTHRTLSLLPVGIFPILHLALSTWSQLYLVAAVHNLMLAAGAGLFLAAVTTGHQEIPGDPRREEIYVWRRQVAFVCPELGIVCSLVVLAWYIQHIGYPILGALVASPAWPIFLHMLGRIVVPILRTWMILEYDHLNAGLANRVAFGGGYHGIRYGSITISKEQVIDVYSTSSLFEFVFGLASLVVIHRGIHGDKLRFRWYAAGSAGLVQQIVYEMKGTWRVGVAEASLIYGNSHPLRSRKINPLDTPAPSR